MYRFAWLISAFLVLACGAPYAMADSLGALDFTYTYTFVNLQYDVTFTTEPLPAATTQTFVPALSMANY